MEFRSSLGGVLYDFRRESQKDKGKGRTKVGDSIRSISEREEQKVDD
jgi:hypothetical protein